ncbi:MAG: hypothetical protein QHC79_17715 [Pseudosphingobacterium sp.]|uniref:hypothetical protein n=1 Tax=Olivibacter sp. 47 TaxID=3056486 RepID=UPI0025A37C9A|nr:hypothetical protein [Olivibacter sp. 47]MDM8173166.1 hypothetical protein [Olivibacter sp. 47]MDX3915386.1 hypothetical protein [Pseudosphingobacterium sp.]
MILPSDKDYKATKLIMQGKAVMNSDFIELADFIYQTFGVSPVNIIYDTFGKENRPRLNLCFEFARSKAIFSNQNQTLGYNAEKQKVIADKFTELVKNEQPALDKRILNFFQKKRISKYKTDDVWVIYSAFEPIAKAEAGNKINSNQIAGLKTKLNNLDLWEISRVDSYVTFFLFTEQQVQQYEHSETRKIWADEYFKLLKPYDEFGYFKRDNFNIFLDSKENFDKNYQSNWYYYYK